MKKIIYTILVIVLMISLNGCFLNSFTDNTNQKETVESTNIEQNETFDLTTVPKTPPEEQFVYLNDNKIDKSNETEATSEKTYIHLSELDNLGRCGSATSIVGPETLPDKKRESIGGVKPSGWPTNGLKNNKYDFIDGKYLFNRCHLIAFSLSGINDDERNLITGTRSLNIKGMWEFEEDVLNYIKNTGNHVFYKVTPIFENDNLLATGVQMQAKSIEDDGLEFNIFAYNTEPGIVIDYTTGENHTKEN